MAQAWLSLEKPDKAVAAQEALTETDPSQGTFQNLAILAYQAGQLRKGDLAAAKAVELAPKDEQKELKRTSSRPSSRRRSARSSRRRRRPRRLSKQRYP